MERVSYEPDNWMLVGLTLSFFRLVPETSLDEDVCTWYHVDLPPKHMLV